MSLELNAEVEAELRERANLAGLDISEFVAQLLCGHTRRAKMKKRPLALRTTAERLAFLEAIAARHPELPEPADCSRESIYADRGK